MSYDWVEERESEEEVGMVSPYGIKVSLLLIVTYYMLTKQGKVNHIKYKNKLITKITKNRAIVKPAKEPLAHEVSQSAEFCIFFQLMMTQTVWSL